MAHAEGLERTADGGDVDVAALEGIASEAAVDGATELDGLDGVVEVVGTLAEASEIVGVEDVGAALFPGDDAHPIDAGTPEDGAV